MTTIVNAEGLVSLFFQEDTGLAALIAGRSYTSLPNGHDAWPAIRVQRIGGGPRLDGLDEPRLQIDCWGGPKSTTWEVAVAAIEALKQRLPGRHPQGYVYGGDGVRVGSLRYLPDPTWDPARPRYSFDVSLLTRP